MNIYKDKCHICLDDKLFINKNNTSCKNPTCDGYICKKCWHELSVNKVETCPLCRETINYTLSQKLLNVKLICKSIFIYLLFYSIGSSCIILSILLINKIEFNETKQTILSFSLTHFLSSLFISPLVGFIIWYIIIVFIMISISKL